MRVRLLGAVQIDLDGRPVEVGRTLELALVARLALEPGRPVADDRLVDDLWEERLPRNPLASLQGLVYRLRRTLGGESVVRRSGSSYVLDVGPDDVDCSRFDALVARSRREADGASARRAVLREALALWNGQAMAGLEMPFVRSQRARLEAARLVALEERLDADMECGDHREVIGELEGLVREHPDEERFWGQLMLALYRSGSQGAALRACERLRRHLLEALGVNPSAAISDLERAILLQDPILAWPPPGPPSRSGRPGSTDVDRELDRAGSAPAPVDGSLPAAPADTVADLIRAARRTARTGRYSRRPGTLPLVGRDAHLRALADVLEGRAGDTEGPFVVVTGEAGCGKTRLLDEFAARARDGGRLVVLTTADDDDVLPYRPFTELVRRSPGLDVRSDLSGAAGIARGRPGVAGAQGTPTSNAASRATSVWPGCDSSRRSSNSLRSPRATRKWCCSSMTPIAWVWRLPLCWACFWSAVPVAS